MEIYNRIHKLGQSKKKNDAQIEREAGLTKSTLNNWKNGSSPSVESLYAVADCLEADPRYIYFGEIKSYQLTNEQQELLDNYERFSLETQIHVKGLFNTLKENMEQVIQENEKEKIELEQRTQNETEKKIILEMLANEADENFVKKVTNISDEQFEVIKKQFEKMQKKKSKS